MWMRDTESNVQGGVVGIFVRSGVSSGGLDLDAFWGRF